MRINIAGVGEEWITPIGKGVVKDMQIMRWNSGKIFIRYLLEDMTGLLARDMVKNVKADYDNLCVVVGAEGSGKSNCTYHIAQAYNKLAFGKDFDVTSQYVYSTDDFQEKLRSGDDRHAVFWMDEATNMANNRAWNTNDSKNFIQLLEVCRSRGWTLFLCIPSLERLDLYIREFRVRYLITCQPMEFKNGGVKERGYYEVRKRTPYGKLEVVGYGEYDRIPEEIKNTYESIKLESQTKKIKEVVDPETPGQKYKAKYEELCKKQDDIMLALHNSGYDNDGLMQLFGIENSKTFLNRLSKARNRK